MKITFLGTGTSQGIPVIACDCDVCHSIDARDKRLRCSVFIETNGKKMVIDTGPDFRQQMLRIQAQHLDAVLFTHEHKDHVAGLDDVRAFNFKQKKAMEVYASQRVQEALKREYEYVFSERKYPGIPEINLNLITHDPFVVKGITVTPIEVMHYQLPVMGFRIQDFTYITDAKTISETELEKIKGSKVLVLNALRKAKHISHFNLEEAIEIADRVEADQVYLTHISHLMGFHGDVEKELPAHIRIAYDGLAISL